MENIIAKNHVKSEIQNFYNGANVFLTGATGAVGQVILEKLLRSCPVKNVYLLIREKKNTSLKERIEELTSTPVGPDGPIKIMLFDRLKEELPGFEKKLMLVAGDCEKPDLGITENDKATLVEQINVVIHCAATVKFNEPLKRATFINVRSTRDIVIISRRMNALKAFVYVSTAYSNFNQKLIKETIYNCNHLNGDTLIQMAETLSDPLMESIMDKCLDTWPNTYTLSKCIAENIIKKYGENMPICITRPGVVISTYNEPFPGWINNFTGLNGLVLGIIVGAIRIMISSKNFKIPLVPSDKLTNLIISSAWYTSVSSTSNAIPVYNYVSNNMSPEVGSRTSIDKIINIGREKKLFSNKQIWYPGVFYAPTKLIFIILTVFLHFIPAILADIYLRLTNHKTRALKMYKKIYKNQIYTSPFGLKEHEFEDFNVMNLIERQNHSDKVLFNVNLANLQWDKYFENCIRGCLQFIFKESGKTNLDVWKRTILLHYGFVIVITICMFYLIFVVVFKY